MSALKTAIRSFANEATGPSSRKRQRLTLFWWRTWRTLLTLLRAWTLVEPLSLAWGGQKRGKSARWIQRYTITINNTVFSKKATVSWTQEKVGRMRTTLSPLPHRSRGGKRNPPSLCSTSHNTFIAAIMLLATPFSERMSRWIAANCQSPQSLYIPQTLITQLDYWFCIRMKLDLLYALLT